MPAVEGAVTWRLCWDGVCDSEFSALFLGEEASRSFVVVGGGLVEALEGDGEGRWEHRERLVEWLGCRA